jgi:hypothetical protein
MVHTPVYPKKDQNLLASAAMSSNLSGEIAAFTERPVFRLRIPVFSAEADGLAFFLSWVHAWVVIGKLQSIYPRSGRLAQLRNRLVALSITKDNTMAG